jgi:hypothetical protein
MIKGLIHWFGSLVQRASVPSLILTFDNIANVPVASASSLSDWNAWLVAHSFSRETVFTSVSVSGNTVTLIGASGVEYFTLSSEQGIVNLYDNGSIYIVTGNGFGAVETLKNVYLKSAIQLGDNGCHDTINLESFKAPNMRYFGFNTFNACAKIKTFYLPRASNLGGNCEISNAVFSEISGATIRLTVPKALFTCNNGSPDEDIVELMANNTVTVVLV